ncbi:hypothetical protein [Desulfosoma caldarium]|uniref:Lipoprotein n=1 Tax=Desulfosoma caldarium TaxID=610254 RepID=A0A3N1VQ00_9BACT|nr:hypothetical protein [Desulfosoma caldarium]ROR03131.1 hypothetical protein EDC27_0388 [Desulfosoma caldarium]
MIRQFVAIGLGLWVLSGCGTSVMELKTPVARESSVGEFKKVVVVPFSDYTPEDSLYGYWRRNILVNEALTDELLRFGFSPVIYEDVIGYLLEQGIIQDATPEEGKSTATLALEKELTKDWSPGMKAEILGAIYRNEAHRRSAEPYWNRERLITLDSEAVRRLGNRFGADYVVRGRLLVFKAGQEDSFNPIQTGLLPFFLKVGSRTVFGVAHSDTYEMIDKMAIGGLVGAALAKDNWPLEDNDKKFVGHPRFGGRLVREEDYASLNTAIWGAAGAGIAFLGHKGGRVDHAWIQLGMIAQDARTGEIVWVNRAEVKVMPKTVFGEKDVDILTSEAIQHAVGRLVDNFVASLTGREVLRSRVDGTFYVTPAGGILAPDRTRYGTILVGPPVSPMAQ